jgi:hypothetical protein
LAIALLPHSRTSYAPIKQTTAQFNFGNQTYDFDNQSLNFVNGKYTNPNQTFAADTAEISNITLNPAQNRAAAIMSHSPGGSGTFYYLLGAMPKDGHILYSQPIPLGDRIKVVSVSVGDPQTYDNGEITVKYLDRPDGVPMAEPPTREVTAKYSFEDSGNLIKVLE